MEFIVDKGGRALGGVLSYIEAEHSFKFDPGEPQELLDRSGGDGVSSILVGTLQIEVGVSSGVALYVWGLDPRTRWHEGLLDVPRPNPGVVRLLDPSVLSRGVSLKMAAVGDWLTLYDPESGWVKVSTRAGDSPEEDRVLIADGTVLGLQDGLLSSIWLQPLFD